MKKENRRRRYEKDACAYMREESVRVYSEECVGQKMGSFFEACQIVMMVSLAVTVSLAIIFALLSPGTANAAYGPGDTVTESQADAAAEKTAAESAAVEEIYTAVDGGQYTKEELADSTISFGELGSLIHTYNTSIQNMLDSTEETRKDYIQILDFFRSEQASAKAEMENAKENGDTEAYAENAQLKAVYQSAARSYNKMITKLDSFSSNKSRLSTEKQLTNGAQSLMISWQSVKLQKESLEKQTELLKAQYEETLTRQQAGLATATEVSTARNNWNSAVISLEEAGASLEELYQNLCLTLGVEESVTGNIDSNAAGNTAGNTAGNAAGTAYTLADIPATDLSQLALLNLEEDTRTAISNNTTVVNTKNTSYGSSTTGVAAKDRAVEEAEETVTQGMQTLYNAVLQAKQDYDAAQTTLASANLTWSNAQTKYSLGMLSHSEYLQQELAWLQKKTSAEAADLSLFQALNAYQWAVKGIMN